MNSYKANIKNEILNFQDQENLKKIILDIIFYHMKDIVFIMKVENHDTFRYVFANEAGLKKAKLDSNYMGKTIDEAMPSFSSQDLKEHYQRVLKTKEPVTYRDSLIEDDGKVFYGESILTPVMDANDHIIFIISVTRDITQSELKKKKMEEGQQRFKSVIDHNLDAILSLDNRGNILSSNPSSYKVLGYSEKQLKNRSVFNLIHESEISKFRNIFSESLNGYALELLECTLIHKNGKHITVYLKTVPIVINAEIKGIYIIFRDITEQYKNLETIKYMVYHDQLTGLLNRTALIKDLDQAIEKAKEKQTEIAILYIDLDRFKYLNDTMGHKVGDQLLRKVGERLSSMEGQSQSVYRIGGDEFVILITNVTRSEVSGYSSKVFSHFDVPFLLEGQDYFITPSIGISMYPIDGQDTETLIRKADSALFQVKERGKAHFQFYSQEMNVHIPNMVTMESQLRRAMDKNELMLYYQPQVDLRTGEINSYEALLRWNNPVLGFVSPGEFIPLAEDTGLIVPIGYWVIEEVCKQIKRWEEKGLRNIKIAVNLSPKQFLQPHLVEKIRAIMEKHKVQPEFLEIEITEGAMQDTLETLKILKQLKKLGLSISVDDFGTGYSSLSYIKQFPLDTIKIDRSFIKEALIDRKDEAIITTIIHLGCSLGLEVVAEGVETEEQVQFLKSVSCHKAQGYLFSKPLSSEEMEETFLKTS